MIKCCKVPFNISGHMFNCPAGEAIRLDCLNALAAPAVQSWRSDRRKLWEDGMGEALRICAHSVRAPAQAISGRKEWEGAPSATLERKGAESLRLFFRLHSPANEQDTTVK